MIVAFTEWAIPDSAGRAVARAIEDRLGAKLSYKNGTLIPARGVMLRGIVFESARGDSVTAESAEASFSLWQVFDLLRGEAPVTSLTIREFELGVVRGEDGDFSLPIDPERVGGRFDVLLVGGKFRYRDIPLGIDHTAHDIHGALHLGSSIHGECEGAFPEAIGGRWKLALMPISDSGAIQSTNSLGFRIDVVEENTRDTGQAIGKVVRREGAAFSSDVVIDISAQWAARFLLRELPATGRIWYSGHAECGRRAFALDGDLRADAIVAGTIAIEGLRARVSADNTRITARDATARVLGGTATITTASIPFADLDAWTAVGTISDADAGRATNGRLGGAALRGSLSAGFKIRGAPRTVHGINGSLSIAVRNGSIDALALARLVRMSGDPSLKPLRFSGLSARVGLSGSSTVIDNLDLRSAQVDAYGSVRVSGRKVAGRVTFRLTKELAAKIVGPLTVALARDRGRVVVPAIVSGTLDEMKVEPAVGGLMAGALNSIARPFRSIFGSGR